jgi:hypothetical protein
MTYKAKSITSKASSACKMNMDLVRGVDKIGQVKKAGSDDFAEGFDEEKEEGAVEPKQ